jgi:hypothetical protein
MNIQRICSILSKLLVKVSDEAARNSQPEPRELPALPNAESIRKLLAIWGMLGRPGVIKYESSLMGCRETIYVKLGSLHLALLQNYDACPDGVNRFLALVPLYAKDHGHVFLWGSDNIPDKVETEASNILIDILAQQCLPGFPDAY